MGDGVSVSRVFGEQEEGEAEEEDDDGDGEKGMYRGKGWTMKIASMKSRQERREKKRKEKVEKCI